MICSTVHSKYIVSHNTRFEGKFYLNESSLLCMVLDTNIDKTKTLDELANVFNPPVFKRQFCLNTEKSVQYFQSSDVPSCICKSPIFVNKQQSQDLNLLVKKNDILITGFGTIGNTSIVNHLQNNVCFANNVCRVQSKEESDLGYLFAFLSSSYGVAQLNRNASGSVVRYIEAPGIKKTLVPLIPQDIKLKINELIIESIKLREESGEELENARNILYSKANLEELTPDEYDYYGACSKERTASTFVVSRRRISTTTINAFNYSARINLLKSKIKCDTIKLSEALETEDFFSTGSFPRVEVKADHGIQLINQSDIFDRIIKGKHISKRGVKLNNLVNYGEVIIAGVGTLGENETFCRTIFANEDLAGQLVSGEFLRMKTTSNIPSGYLYTWLSCDYGFRLIRHTQTGTKLCRPIQKLLLEQPVPIIDNESMLLIDEIVKEAHTKKHQANLLELEAIHLAEQEIDKWNK